jgi:hypothetical protein
MLNIQPTCQPLPPDLDVQSFIDAELEDPNTAHDLDKHTTENSANFGIYKDQVMFLDAGHPKIKTGLDQHIEAVKRALKAVTESL